MSTDSKPIISCLGDIHLSQHIWTRFPHIQNDSSVGFDAFIDGAIEIGAPIMIAGDLFDVAKPTPDLVEICRAGFDRCADARVPVYVIQGNHDKQPTPWVKAIHEHPIYVGDGKPFRLGSHTAIASDYRLMDDIRQFIQDIPDGVEIVFLHQAAKQALAFDGAWNCDLEWLPPSVRVCILGDIHKPLNMPLSGGRMAYYTGAGHARDITQTDPKSFLVLHDDLSISRRPLPSREIRKFTVIDDSQVKHVSDWLSTARPCTYTTRTLLPFAWVVHAPELLPAMRGIIADYSQNGRAIIFCDPAPSAEDVQDIVAEPDIDQADMSLASAVGRVVDRTAEPVLYQLVVDVLTSKRAVDTIVSYRDKALNNG